MHRGILALLLILAVTCQNNYQQRAIFYGPSNNICCGEGRNHRDNVNVIINLDDSDRIRLIYEGLGYCANMYIFCQKSIAIYPTAAIVEGQFDTVTTQIVFNQEAIYTKARSVIEQINYKWTVRNPVLIAATNYTCTILGDGTVHHWGTDYKEYPPAEVYMRCLSAKKLEEEQKKQGMVE